MKKAFWKEKKLTEMTATEWESLCDGCGLCCLHKLRDSDSGEVIETGVACHLLDCETCRCRDYKNRMDLVSDCVRLSAENIGDLDWLPKTCAYRLVFHGEDLYDWHPLVSGSRESVHAAGISARGRCVSEADIDNDYWRQLERRLNLKILQD